MPLGIAILWRKGLVLPFLTWLAELPPQGEQAPGRFQARLPSETPNRQAEFGLRELSQQR